MDQSQIELQRWKDETQIIKERDDALARAEHLQDSFNQVSFDFFLALFC